MEGKPTNWEVMLPFGMGSWLTHVTPLPTCYPANLIIRKMVRASLRRFAWKNWPHVSRLSRSLDVIGTINSHWSDTYNFLLTFHSNHGSILYRFRDKRQFEPKIANLTHPCIQCPPQGRSSPRALYAESPHAYPTAHSYIKPSLLPRDP